MTSQIASSTAIVLGFLVFLLLGGRLIRYFGIAAEGGLDVGLLFKIIGYNLPYFLELILPLSFFIALMLVFGRLYVDHEMAVINGSGISRGRLARLVAPLILVLFLLEAGLSIVGKPWGVRQSDNVWQQQAMQSAFDLVKPGQFLSSGDYHLYVGSLSDDNSQLENVILIQTSKDKNKAQKIPEANQPEALKDLPTLPKQLSSKDTIVLAKSAQQVATDDESGKTQLDLFNGRRYEIGADSLKYNQVGFERYRITLLQKKEDKVSKENIETQKIEDIWTAATANTAKPNLAAQAELGYRFALPWLIILAPMMAVPLAQVRPRQGRWLRLIPAILLYVSVALSIISLKKPVSEGKVDAWMYALLIVFLLAFALYLNWASRINQRVRFGLFNKNNRIKQRG
ncbi:LPS export ABC transporter permease LptF [Psychrobacter sp. HD31]|uniref:LPS export ABC transporter permease LptF n=1 Tax=Psychrobacter sp. HD31 TaxID=3112003 RepID=UPI003DA35EE5